MSTVKPHGRIRHRAKVDPIESRDQFVINIETPASGPGQLSDWRVTLGADRLAGRDLGSMLTPLPTPLMVSGISPKVLSTFRDVLAKRGLQLMDGPGGGTSDARFISRYCPVAEFGLVGITIHQTDECVPVSEIRKLSGIYKSVIESFLK